MKLDEPRKRTNIRLFLGKKYYTYLRYFQWYTSKIKFANAYCENNLPYRAFIHKTPLIRKLSGVDIGLQYNKINNLKLASSKLNGLILKQGELFSFWKLVGKPTYRKGYRDGLILNPDGTFRAGAGGGLCQLSNIIYWITLHTPLTVTQRYRHSHDIFPDTKRTQPFGSGATCVYNYIDLQILNNTNYTYQLVVNIDEEYLWVEWRTDIPQDKFYEIYEKEHFIKSTYWGGYIRHNAIYRKVFNESGEQISDEFITENNALMMYTPLLT
ncbi:MAG: VanW family protein [Bacillota bacterium]|nr:VanW family protein [Bacillota bacterium]